MPIVASCLPLALLRPTTPAHLSPAFFFRHRFLLSSLRFAPSKTPRLGVLVASSAASFDELDAKGWSKQRSPKKSVLSDLIQEVEPLDLNLIQKDVPPVTVDAMKRTISGMLGILPSDRFNVVVEALWVHLFKLLVSSMMTGYTLHNAEYRLSLERNLEIFEDHRDKGLLEKDELENVIGYDRDKLLDRTPKLVELPERRDEVQFCEDFDYEGLGEMTSEAKEYIRSLKCRLSSMEKDLHEANKKNSALQMQQFVGEEKNDLLDYLRSLQPEKSTTPYVDLPAKSRTPSGDLPARTSIFLSLPGPRSSNESTRRYPAISRRRAQLPLSNSRRRAGLPLAISRREPAFPCLHI